MPILDKFKANILYEKLTLEDGLGVTKIDLNPLGVSYFNAGNVGVGTTAPTAKVDVSSDILRLRTAKTPASAGATGNQGDICWDSGYLYICVATNTWKRAMLTTWF
jgi:hypothetical protein